MISGFLNEDQMIFLSDLGVKKVLHKPLRIPSSSKRSPPHCLNDA